MTPQQKARKQTLQISLEQTVNYIFDTGDTSILDSPLYRKVRTELAELLQAHPQKAATNYADGGPAPNNYGKLPLD